MRIGCKFLAILSVLCLLLACVPFTAAAEEAKKVSFSSTQWQESTEAPNNGKYFMKHDTLSLTAHGEQGFAVAGAGQVLFAFEDSFVQKHPFLHFKQGEQSAKFVRVTRREAYWVAENAPELTLEATEGENTVNLAELLKDHPAKNTGWVYVAVGVSESTEIAGSPAQMEYMYLSNTDASGQVYQKPTQPAVPQLDPAKEIRYQLHSFADQNTDEYGYGFLLSDNIKATPSDKGVTLERAEGVSEGLMNIAWVVPYEQLAQTPYLVIDIANDGRADEGPRTKIYAYWEGVQGSTAVFDAIPEEIGANSLHGQTRLPLKYAIDTVPEHLRGENGIAIIVSIRVQRTDGTSLEPLVIRDAYLLGYQEGAAPVTGTTTAQNTTAPQNGDGQPKGDMPVGLLIGLAGGAVVLVAVVAVVLMRKKKNK